MWIQADVVESVWVGVKERGIEFVDLTGERLELRHTLTELQSRQKKWRVKMCFDDTLGNSLTSQPLLHKEHYFFSYEGVAYETNRATERA